jgi:hypothetical protein
MLQTPAFPVVGYGDYALYGPTTPILAEVSNEKHAQRVKMRDAIWPGIKLG